MFKFILVAAVLGLVAAVDDERAAEVKSFVNTAADAEGNFNYGFESSNGISVQESGNLDGVNGAAHWTSADGSPVDFTYTADADGYHPAGALLPTPPPPQPIPELILKALAYLESHPNEENRQPSYLKPLTG